MYELVRSAHYRFINIPRKRKRFLMMMLDAACLPICLWSAYALRLSDWWPSLYMHAHWFLFPLISITGVFLFSSIRIYRTILRYIGSTAVLQILKAVGILSLLLFSMGLIVRDPIIPRSVPIIFGLVTLFYVGLTRFFYRYYYHWLFDNIIPSEAVAVYGAGQAGAQIVSAIADSRDYKAVAFLDDDPNMWGSLVQGLRVYSPQSLGLLEEKYNVERVLLAMPSASREQRRKTVERLAAQHLKILTVPSLSEIVSGESQVANLRAVEIEDLLGREPVPPLTELLETSIKEQTVLVTGAGGSIGSELCRQILTIGPDRLILFDASEYNLYAITQELSEQIKQQESQTELVPILGSVTDPLRLGMVVSKFKVQTFYHAAAFKHVPLVEQNVFAGIHNNIFGTRIACETAARCNVKRFILVSTDKAVRPTNVMGATKRAAELIVQDMAQRDDTSTIFSMVRFGNVLGSSGSVVPLFRHQIANGGPITVTHRDITRYFMTINEAALLVIQAGSMAQGGDVFVLDMGNEIKIYDMARQMILLSGLEVRDEDNPDGDIEIVISGLRPAEKIREELLIGDNVLETHHPRILRAEEERLPSSEITSMLAELEEAHKDNDVTRAKRILAKLVSGYEPSAICSDYLALENPDHTEPQAKGGNGKANPLAPDQPTAPSSSPLAASLPDSGLPDSGLPDSEISDNEMKAHEAPV